MVNTAKFSNTLTATFKGTKISNEAKKTIQDTLHHPDVTMYELISFIDYVITNCGTIPACELRVIDSIIVATDNSKISLHVDTCEDINHSRGIVSPLYDETAPIENNCAREGNSCCSRGSECKAACSSKTKEECCLCKRVKNTVEVTNCILQVMNTFSGLAAHWREDKERLLQFEKELDFLRKNLISIVEKL